VSVLVLLVCVSISTEVIGSLNLLSGKTIRNDFIKKVDAVLRTNYLLIIQQVRFFSLFL
jgi:hypothetical protein